MARATQHPEKSMPGVILDRHGPTALLRLNNPANLNSLGGEVRLGLEKEIPLLAKDRSLRCLILTGEGEAFCAGGDLRQMQERTAPKVRARLQDAHAWARLLQESEILTIAAVNGAAAGAGLSLALLCDFVLMSERAYFRAGFPAVGAAPDLAVAYMLPRAVGLLRAKDILLTNRRVEPAEALAMGLTSRVLPADQLIPAARALADQLAAGPRTGLSLAKALLNRAQSTGLGQFLEAEALAQAVAFASPEFAEGVAAFLEKRRPDFSKA